MNRLNLAIILAVLFAFSARAETFDEPEQCELALRNLVNKLETENQLSEDTKVEKLPDVQTTYSVCAVVGGRDNDGESVAYLVSRHSDDVTVFVQRTMVGSPTWEMFGPFYSAYRK